MVAARIYVEGGRKGSRELETLAREAFSKLFERAGLDGRLPRVMMCGSRGHAFRDFKIALQTAGPDGKVYLLVDAEAPVSAEAPSEDAAWAHVAERVGDAWSRPSPVHADHLHLMVQAMEAWLFADPDALNAWFGPKFDEQPGRAAARAPERIAKANLVPTLDRAARNTPKGAYGKGRDSFGVLRLVDPARLEAASPWARRLFETLRRDL